MLCDVYEKSTHFTIENNVEATKEKKKLVSCSVLKVPTRIKLNTKHF